MPGISFNELDFNQYAVAISGTTVCLVGGARKGPLNTPTECNTEGQFVQTFGKPLTNDYGGQAAVRYLRRGNKLVYLRVANSSAIASRTLSGTTGGTAAVAASGTVTFTASYLPADEDIVTISDGVTSKVFEFDDDSTYTSGRIPVLIGATSAATMANLIAAINNSPLTITATDSTVSVPRASLVNRTAGTAGNVSITTSATGDIAVSGMSSGAAAIAGSSASVLTLYAATPGTWGNEVQVVVTQPSVVPGATTHSFDLDVYAPTEPGAPLTKQETFRNLYLDTASTRFVETALANGIAEEFRPSRYITADATASGHPTAGTFMLGAGGGTVGADGVSGLAAADYVGTVSGQTATGLKALANKDTTRYEVIAIPGVTHATVITALLAHCAARRDCWAVLDTPFGLSPADAISWVNGGQPAGVSNSPASMLNTSHVAVYAPWGQAYDPYNRVNIWLPPSALVPGTVADVDRINGQWAPVAGQAAVVSDLTRLEYSPDADQRTSLYAANINPLVRFPEGTVVHGNRTLLRTASPLQDLDTRRLLIYAMNLISGAVRYLTWSPNDSALWSRLEQLCNEPLRQIASARGLAAFRVACNESTNPDEVVARREVRCKIVLRKTPVMEDVVIDVAVTSSGAVFDEITTGVSA